MLLNRIFVINYFFGAVMPGFYIGLFTANTCVSNAFVFRRLFSFLAAFFSLGEYLENKCNQNYMGVDFALPLVNFKAYGHVFQVLLVGNGGGERTGAIVGLG